MPIPDFQTLILPILRFTGDGREHDLAEATAFIVKEFRLTDAEQREKLNSGQSRLYNRVVWSVSYLTRAKFLTRLGRGRFTIAERGREVLLDPPERIDVMYLQEKSPEVKQFRPKRRALPSNAKTPATFDAGTATWATTRDSYERIKEKVERAIPKESERLNALQFLASTIEKANEERTDAWLIRETQDGVKLMAGRFMACRILRSKLRVSVIGPIDETLRSRLGMDDLSDDDLHPSFRFKSIPGGVTLTFSSANAAVALESLKSYSNLFIEMGMAKVRNTGALSGHAAEAVEYLRDVTHRQLPQPTPAAASESINQDDSDDRISERNREPHVRGRAPIFEVGQRSISSLIGDIERGAIALPELQRPFVWEDTKVRDLLDSLFVGFPVGTLVFWYTSTEQDARALGSDNPGLKATTLVIDGQQRLTSLYAVMKGVDVVGKDGTQRRINIAFRPRDGRFEVADAAIRNDPEFIPDVTDLWRGVRSKPQMRRDLLNALRDKGHAVSEEYEDAVDRNIDRAHGINEYRFPTVDIRKTAAHEEATTEEDVAEIFVRINNQGTRLGQADFVLTLLSVFHGKLRDQIETRAREMSGGTVISVDTQQLLRAVCAVAFGRARMSAVYRYLRGVDPTTGMSQV